MAEKIPFTGGDYRRYNDKKYLHHYDLPNGEDLVVTIERIDTELLENKKKNTQETRLVLYFAEDVKPLALNREINPKSISKALNSTDTLDWIGGKIALYVGNESRADDGKAVRIRDTAPKVKTAICENCGCVIEPHEADGKTYSVNKIVARSKARFGETLCWDCSIARMGGAE